MIKLVDRKLTVDRDAFTSVCRITIDIPIESAVDYRVFQGEDELCAVLGKEVLESVQGNHRFLIDCVKEAWVNASKE